MRRFVCLAALVAGCDPSLGDEPFLCGSDGTCPDGYACTAGVCVAKGVVPESARVTRVEWINAGEMFWVPNDSGATLVVNDGFTGDRQGIYRIDVAADGTVSDPVALVPYVDPFPRSSSVALLDDGRLGVATQRFPGAESDDIELDVVAIDLGTGTKETLHHTTEPYLGGFEPSYISLVAGLGTIDVAWTRPSGGGAVEVIHFERNGSTFTVTSGTGPLDSSVLPLSGDCLLWPLDDGSLALRVGFESFAVARVDVSTSTPVVQPFVPFESVPLWAFDDHLVALRYGDATVDGTPITLETVDYTDVPMDSTAAGVLGDDTEPYDGARSADSVLVAPLLVPDDPTAVGIGEVAADGSYAIAATLVRAGDNAF